jgi:hypothetical protein
MNEQEMEKLLDHPMFKVENACYGWPPGWDKILVDLIERIKENLNFCEGLEVKVQQIKEKFGGLRFYYSLVAEEKLSEEKETLRQAAITAIKNSVNIAESKSYETCELCGSTDAKEANTAGWIVTACKTCAEKNGWK